MPTADKRFKALRLKIYNRLQLAANETYGAQTLDEIRLVCTNTTNVLPKFLKRIENEIK